MSNSTGVAGGLNAESRVDFHQLVTLDPDALRCPHLAMRDLRETEPISFSTTLDAWVVTRYADILEAVRQPEVFSSVHMNGPVTAAQRQRAIEALADEQPEIAAELTRVRGSIRVLIFADPPAHLRQRKLVNRAFTPARIEALEPRLREIANELADAFVDRGEADIVSEFAGALPLRVIAELVGVSAPDRDRFKMWSDAVVGGLGKPNMTPAETRAVMLSQYEFIEYFIAQIADRRVNPRDDLISVILAATIDEEPLTDVEIINMLIQFLTAGNETTAKLISSAMVLLLRDPQLAQRLRADHSLVPPFIEELLRLESPVQGLFRTATEDTELAGQAIANGEHLLLAWASGNRDDAKFERPEELDLARGNKLSHLAFGNGEHFCLGASLARAEARIGVETLLSRLDNVRLDDAADIDHLAYLPSMMLHGPVRLPVVFGPR